MEVIPQNEQEVSMSHLKQELPHHQTDQLVLERSTAQSQVLEDSQKKVGRFTINYEKELGSGSFSNVYKAYDTSDKIFQLAVKIIAKSKLTQQLQKLLQTEIQVLKFVNHPNIVKCYEVIEDESYFYIFLQLCNEGDLESKVDKQGRFSETEALAMIRQILSALLYLQRQKIIHRDIKVANVFLHNGKAKLADFGFAVFNQSNKPFNDINIGSPIYMSPEGIKHNVYGPRTDVWAFGIFMYELLHGKTPYSHCTKEKELQYNISNPLSWNSMNPDLSYCIKDAILKCLEINYEKRISFQELSRMPIFAEYFSSEKKSVGKEQKYSQLPSTPAFRQKLNTQQDLDQDRAKSPTVEKNGNYDLPPGNIVNTLQSVKVINKEWDKYENFSRNSFGHLDQVFLQKSSYKELISPRTDRTVKIVENRNIYPIATEKQLCIKSYKGIRSQESFQDPQFSFLDRNLSQRKNLRSRQTSLSPKNRKTWNKFNKVCSQQQPFNQLRHYRENFPQRKNRKHEYQTPNISSLQQNHSNKKLTQGLCFPERNTNCYLYLLHFCRFTFKLIMELSGMVHKVSRSLNQQLGQLCIHILTVLDQKIGNVLKTNRGDRSGFQDLRQIRTTVDKYLMKYSQDLGIFHFPKLSASSLLTISSELQSFVHSRRASQKGRIKGDITVPLSESLKMSQYYISEFDLFRKNFLSEKTPGSWFQNSLQHIVRDIETLIKNLDSKSTSITIISDRKTLLGSETLNNQLRRVHFKPKNRYH